MAYHPLSAPHTGSDEEFYAVIDHLKSQDALPKDSFLRYIPFFHFPTLSKEFQVKELFQESWDPEMFKALLKNIITSENPEHDPSSPSSPLARLSTSRMMTFAQLILYKVLPCPDPNCASRPREIVTHNQYKDHEYECPFYHHERDRRRIVINCASEEEFIYKANYFEEGRSHAEKEKYSQNYFESMFHPLYYKMFRCKREFCSSCQFCPFYHYEQEKKTWDKMFGSFIKKDRITYVKDKQKYYESTSNNNTPLIKAYNSSFDQSQSPTKSPDFTEKRPQRNQRKNNKNQRSPPLQNQNRNPNIQNYNEMKPRGKPQQFSNYRKDSNDSFGLNTDPFGIFGNTKQIATYRAC